MSFLNRRSFLNVMKNGTLATALAGSQFKMVRNALAATPPSTGYKALVCVFLYGGNDAFNMLVPTGTTHDTYSEIRGDLAVAKTDLNLTANFTGNALTGGNPYNQDQTEETAYVKGIYPLSGSLSPLGVNGVMPELAKLITDGKVSVVANTGTLVQPTTRTQILNKTANLPLFLFAHNHQQRELQTGQADNLTANGWAGRIADNWSGINAGAPIGLNISYAGNDRMLIGDVTTPLILQPGSPISYSGMNKDYTSHTNRRNLLTALAGINPKDDPFIAVYNSMRSKSLKLVDWLNNNWPSSLSFSTTGPYGESLFDVPDKTTLDFTDDISTRLIKQLEAVATMINIGKADTNVHRQVFFVQLGGFDNHASQKQNHCLLLRALSLGLWKFQKALEELNLDDGVTTFTMSDFGRTMSNNGDGTDHAWGSHQLVMSGDPAFKGGQLSGTLPDLTLGGPDDYSSKGRIIPTTAVDQINATLASWLGVDIALMPAIFPNLSNFQTGSTIDTAFLDLFT